MRQYISICILIFPFWVYNFYLLECFKWALLQQSDASTQLIRYQRPAPNFNAIISSKLQDGTALVCMSSKLFRLSHLETLDNLPKHLGAPFEQLLYHTLPVLSYGSYTTRKFHVELGSTISSRRTFQTPAVSCVVVKKLMNTFFGSFQLKHIFGLP